MFTGRYLRYCEQLPQTSWPSVIDQLSTTETELPELVTLFMTELLKTKSHNPSRSGNIRRLIQSYSADLVHGVRRGDTIAIKHFVFALGVHIITGLLFFLDVYLRNRYPSRIGLKLSNFCK